MIKQIVSISMLPILLGGCAIYNFAPPNVDVRYAVEEGGGLNTQCRIHPNTQRVIEPDIKGASILIENFSLAYRCAARQLADGRQHFEVPALLATLGGTTAAAFGAPASVAIGTGAGVAGLNGAKSYYAPKDKLSVLVAAVDAIHCIRNASVAVDSFGSTILTAAAPTRDTQAGGAPDARAAAAATLRDNPAGSVSITAISQYFALIQDALLAVENIVAQRLASAGAYAPDAIVNELKSIAVKKDEQSADTPDNTQKKATIKAQAALVARSVPTGVDEASKAAAVTSVLLQIDKLKPQLDECIVRAKI